MRRIDNIYNCVRCNKPLSFNSHFKKPCGLRFCEKCNKEIEGLCYQTPKPKKGPGRPKKEKPVTPESTDLEKFHNMKEVIAEAKKKGKIHER